jgi:hypothetical protein
MAAGSATPPPGDERYGPLAVLRTRKDDGRSLILYSDSRAPEGAEADREQRAPERRA